MQNTLGGSKLLLSLGMAVAMVLAMQPTLSAQETTGGIEVYVRDESGGAVVVAAVELSGPSLLAPADSKQMRQGMSISRRFRPASTN